MNKKYIIPFCLFIGSCFSYSQNVGVNTESPKSNLDVNGTTQFRGKLSVLTGNQQTPSEGIHNQILVSQGEGNPPVWKSLVIPEYEPDKFYLIYNSAKSDNVGLLFPSNTMIPNKPQTFIRGTLLSNLPGFEVIDGLTQKFIVNSENSRVYFQFETIVHSNMYTLDGSIDYACGIFVDEKLQGLRQGTLLSQDTAVWPFLLHNQVAILQNPTLGEHTVKVACSRLNSYRNNRRSLSIGTFASGAANLSSFATKSSLRVEVYEIPQKFIPIIEKTIVTP